MATYKARLSSGSTYKGDFKITWATATQEELAYAYEEVGLNNLIEKITKTKDESEKTSKKKPPTRVYNKIHQSTGKKTNLRQYTRKTKERNRRTK